MDASVPKRITIQDTAHTLHVRAVNLEQMLNRLEDYLFGENDSQKGMEAMQPQHLHGLLQATESIMHTNESLLEEILSRLTSAGNQPKAYAKARDLA
jgi:hypothetical protein